FFLLPACSASAKLIWLIALAPLQGSALHARNVLLIRPSLDKKAHWQAKPVQCNAKGCCSPNFA
ncbi:hypothetical protein ACSFBX_25290, partial [Variovorax sp. RB2P76]|uniref:hypothetical protein n=1 Tax=Variovorax sp. RB2P76 TaxID=3443736 RepID=UPI003F47E201